MNNSLLSLFVCSLAQRSLVRYILFGLIFKRNVEKVTRILLDKEDRRVVTTIPKIIRKITTKNKKSNKGENTRYLIHVSQPQADLKRHLTILFSEALFSLFTSRLMSIHLN